MDAQSIREKRLARLGGSRSYSSGSNNDKKTDNNEESSINSKDIEHISSLASESRLLNQSSTSNNFSDNTNNTSKVQVNTKSNINKIDSMELDASIGTESRSSKTKSLSLASKFLQASDSEWENKTFEFILNATLSEEEAQKRGYLFLKDTLNEFKAENLESIIVSSNIERVLYSRLSIPYTEIDKPLLRYLISCWIRTGKIDFKIKGLLSIELDDSKSTEKLHSLVRERLEKIKTVKKLIINYSSLVLNPDLAGSFPQDASIEERGFAYLGQCIIDGDELGDEAITEDFLNALFLQFSDEELIIVISGTVNGINSFLRTQDIGKNFMKAFHGLFLLLSNENVLRVFPKINNFNPNVNARSFEIISTFGPFFSRISSFPDSSPMVPGTYFPRSEMVTESQELWGCTIGHRLPGDIESSRNLLSSIQSSVNSQLHRLLMTVIRSSSDNREKIIEYLSHVMDLNKPRGKMQFDRAHVSTDGFMFNILSVCIKLFQPITDVNYSKLHLIDPNYLFTCKHFDIEEETCISATKDQLDKHIELSRMDAGDKQPNFISHIFYLTLLSIRYGFISAIKEQNNIIKYIEDIQKHLKQLDEIKASGRWNEVVHGRAFKNLSQELDNKVGAKLAMDVGLRDKSLLLELYEIYNTVIMFLIRCTIFNKVSNGDKNQDKVSWYEISRGNIDKNISMFPLDPKEKESDSLIFEILPEWILEDLCEFYLYIAKYEPIIFENKPRNEILLFSNFILQNPYLIRNPHLKSKLVQILFTFTWPLYQNRNGERFGRIDDVFTTNPVAKEFLIPSIIRFYVDVESTGVSSQFYDKFNIRYNISQIFKSVWRIAEHRLQIIKLTKSSQFFVKFIALLMNDTTYLLDESLSKLKEIQQLQKELKTPPLPNSPPEAQREFMEKKSLFSQLESQALSYMSLGNETVHMLQYLTSDEEIVKPFFEPELVDRLAAMLDFNLSELVGPRCTDFKVENPEKYRFNPKKLLCELIEIYLHLGTNDIFVAAVAKDGRSYKKEHFDHASQIIVKNGLMLYNDLEPLREFVTKVEKHVERGNEEELELGDIPDEYADPLLYTLMEDPVTLPTSGVVVDRSTIKSHLLSDAHDPFNRQPLKLEDVISNIELKEKILKWKSDKIKSKH